MGRRLFVSQDAVDKPPQQSQAASKHEVPFLQAEAQIPILGCPESDIKGFFAPVLHLCSEFWGQLLEQVCHRPGHEPKLAKAAIEGIAAELSDLLPQPEWPGAHVLLHVMCKSLVEALQGGKGASGGLETTREDREHLLDVAGFLVAKVRPVLFPPFVFCRG